MRPLPTTVRASLALAARFLLGPGLLLLVSSGRAGAPATPSGTATGLPFECATPKGWQASRWEGGLRLLGPAGEGGVRSMILLRHYPSGHGYFPDLETFLRRQTAPGPFGPAAATPALDELLVAGRKARRVRRRSSEFVPPRSLDSREIPISDESVAVPASQGFYVISYRASRSLDKKGRAAFQIVLSSFRPRL